MKDIYIHSKYQNLIDLEYIHNIILLGSKIVGIRYNEFEHSKIIIDNDIPEECKKAILRNIPSSVYSQFAFDKIEFRNRKLFLVGRLRVILYDRNDNPVVFGNSINKTHRFGNNELLDIMNNNPTDLNISVPLDNVVKLYASGVNVNLNFIQRLDNYYSNLFDTINKIKNDGNKLCFKCKNSKKTTLEKGKVYEADGFLDELIKIKVNGSYKYYDINRFEIV